MTRMTYLRLSDCQTRRLSSRPVRFLPCLQAGHRPPRNRASRPASLPRPGRQQRPSRRARLRQPASGMVRISRALPRWSGKHSLGQRITATGSMPMYRMLRMKRPVRIVPDTIQDFNWAPFLLALRNFDPDQPRDPDGKWTSGGAIKEAEQPEKD